MTQAESAPMPQPGPREDLWQLKTYAKIPVAPVRAEGAWLYGADGRKWLDFYGGHAVASTGHCHPEVVAAIREQAGRLLFYSNAVANDARADAAEALVRFGYPELTRVFLTNSGAEANEAAMKMARKFTGREEIIYTDGSFHGRTMACLAVCGIPRFRAFKPEMPGTRKVPFGDAQALEEAVTDRTAAVLLEPLQSLQGMRLAEPGYYRAAREIATRRGACLVFDEVQTGLGRTGRPMIGMHWGVAPDLATSAKGIASGLPIGATWIHDRIARTIALGEHGATFGGGPVVCAAAAATLRVIVRERLWERAARLHGRIAEGVARLGAPYAGVRGLGLLLGIETSVPANPLRMRLMEEGLVVGDAIDPNILRLMPPLTIGEAEVDAMLDLLAKVHHA